MDFKCDKCGKALYRVENNRVQMNEDGSIPKKPIEIVIKYRKNVLCSKKCLLDHVEVMSEDELRSAGYTIW